MPGNSLSLFQDEGHLLRNDSREGVETLLEEVIALILVLEDFSACFLGHVENETTSNTRSWKHHGKEQPSKLIEQLDILYLLSTSCLTVLKSSPFDLRSVMIFHALGMVAFPIFHMPNQERLLERLTSVDRERALGDLVLAVETNTLRICLTDKACKGPPSSWGCEDPWPQDWLT